MSAASAPSRFFAIAAVIYYLIAKVVTLGARLLARRMFRY